MLAVSLIINAITFPIFVIKTIIFETDAILPSFKEMWYYHQNKKNILIISSTSSFNFAFNRSEIPFTWYISSTMSELRDKTFEIYNYREYFSQVSDNKYFVFNSPTNKTVFLLKYSELINGS